MDPADPERPPTAEGGASGAEKGKKRDEIASISSNEPSGGTQVETDGLKGGGVEHDDGDGGDASPESVKFRCAFANASEHQFASRRLNLRALRGAYWIAPAPSRPSLACRRGRMCES